MRIMIWIECQRRQTHLALETQDRKKVTLFTTEVGGECRKERESVDLAGNGAEGWKELAQPFHQQPSCYIIAVVMLLDIEIH